MNQYIEENIFEIKKIDRGQEKNILCTTPVHFLPDIRNQLEHKYNVIYAL
jgi:hypothetical protein